MFNNLSQYYQSVLKERIESDFFIYHDLHFWDLDLSDVENFDLTKFQNKKNILILNSELVEIKDTDSFRKLISSCFVFTKYNFLKLFGVPESTFHFNPLFDDHIYYINNNESRAIEVIYDNNIDYDADVLNKYKKLIINSQDQNMIDKKKFFIDVLRAFACGCSVFITDEVLLKMFDDEDCFFINKSLNQAEILRSQEHFHLKYGYTYQATNIKKQLIGILGDEFDFETSS